jgi:hypothetical protein
MNSIILIGNGFDLAHGLKTKYRDFIEDFDFWGERMKELPDGVKSIYEAEEKVEAFDRLYGGLYQKILREYRGQFKPLEEEIKKAIENARETNYFLYNTFSNLFFKEISEKAKSEDKNIALKNWVDIEVEYYLALKKCLKGERNGGIERLNQDFSKIQKMLEAYLIKQSRKCVEPSEEILKKIRTIINDEDGKTNERLDNKRVLFLSFNYTKTEEKYFKYITNGVIPECIHINGEIESKENPMVFGYGDELDSEYKHIEDLNDNRFFENVKSIKYLETDNYKKLLDYIEDDKYKIFVMGHSCGISDRSLLNTLFENKNCSSIKVYYRKKGDGDNYSDVLKNINRNFTNKSLMRERVINKIDSEPLV